MTRVLGAGVLGALLLAGCQMGQVRKAVDEGHAELAARYLDDLTSQIEVYYLSRRRLPRSLAELDARDPTSGETLARGVDDDPWGRPYGYEVLGPTRYRVWSVGLDGQPGTADDIVRTRGRE